MAVPCLICGHATKNVTHRDDSVYIDCDYCKPYSLTRTALAVLQPQLEGSSPDVPRIKAVLSHAIGRRYERGRYFNFNSRNLEQIIKDNWLPSLPEQINNLIRWFGENLKPGEGKQIVSSDFQAIVGAETVSGAAFVLKHAVRLGMIEATDSKELTRDTRFLDAKLSMAGWERFEELNRGAIDSRKAFMAMKYDEPESDALYARFRIAVEQTGFDLVRLDQQPKAGLIDDKLRVEILTSRFLISDLTHRNPGAYWEAGYAEGLGKPVVYTCSKKVFDVESTHFDTNHQTTILWEADKLDDAAEKLKNTIRATLRHEAKLAD